MKEQIISQLAPILMACIMAIITRVVKIVGDAIIDLIEVKREEVIKRIGNAKYNENKSIALDIWNIVEEHFRITSFIGNSIQLKIDMFNKLLLEKVPGLNQTEINELRQTIAGEINKGKEKNNNTNTVSIDTKQLQDLQSKAQAFTQIQSTFNQSQQP